MAPALPPGTLAGVGIVLAAVGFWERRTRELVLARDLEIVNAYESFFRTASLMRDPSIYGRHLVVAILVVLVGLWLTRLNLVVGTVVIGFLAAALHSTYWQSSMIALVVGILFVAAVAGSGRGRIVVLAELGALVVASAVFAAVGRDESLRNLTSGRSDLIANAADIVRDHPFGGVGIGAEEKVERGARTAR